MEKQQLLEKNFVTEEEWNLTPDRVKDLVVQQKLKIKELEKQLEELKNQQDNLQEKVDRNSDNSNSSPSTDLIKPETKKRLRPKRSMAHPMNGRVTIITTATMA